MAYIHPDKVESIRRIVRATPARKKRAQLVGGGLIVNLARQMHAEAQRGRQ